MTDVFEERLEDLTRGWRAGPKRGCELTEPLDRARDHVVGDPGAPVAIVEYHCYGSAGGCELDRTLRAPLRELLLAGRICFGVRQFPVPGIGPHAIVAACAVEAAAFQQRFWDLHETITLRVALGAPGETLATNVILTLARQRDIDVERLRRDMEHPAVGERILRDFGSGTGSGVNGTPTFYVDGIRQIVDRPEELLRRVDRALAGDRDALWPPVRPAVRPVSVQAELGAR